MLKNQTMKSTQGINRKYYKLATLKPDSNNSKVLQDCNDINKLSVTKNILEEPPIARATCLAFNQENNNKNPSSIDLFKMVCIDSDKPIFNSVCNTGSPFNLFEDQHASSNINPTTTKSSLPTAFNNNEFLNINVDFFETDPFTSILEGNKNPTRFAFNLDSPVFSSPNLSTKLPSTKDMENSMEDEFSQFCKTTQNMKQLDDVLSETGSGVVRLVENKDSSEIQAYTNNFNQFLTPSSFYGKDCKRKSDGSAEQNLKIPKVQQETSSLIAVQEISSLFENLEQSICNFGPDRDESLNDERLDFLLNQAVENTESCNNAIGLDTSTIFKKFLTENAAKGIVSQKLVNGTIFDCSIVEFQDLGPFYGLPNRIKELIKKSKGIDKLYDWQDECLQLPAIKNRKNLIYSLPTSGGKTLVAEILILREIICRKRNVIFILPYVAIVQEKVWALSPFAVALDFLVEEYAAGKGVCPPRKRRHKHSVYIATTEKALSLVNSLVELGRLEEIGLVVVDELHLIGDEQRGPTLEALLTKLMYLNASIQIIGMSATIGNLPDIQRFLNADVYSRNFRPIELTEYVKCERQIAKINWKEDVDNILEVTRTVNFCYSEEFNKIDPDHLGGLVMEVVPKESCLIFCPSKKNCENVTVLLCKILSRKLREYKSKEKEDLLKSLRDEAGTVCDILRKSIPLGIAYHHSGLTAEERKLVEEAYRIGVLYVICCTSTLAAGVNLPAKRVIIRKPYIAQDFINLSRYKQMVGRAGRAGQSELGESILICPKQDLPKVRELLTTPMDQTLSKMHKSEGTFLRNLFLSCIGLGLANTRNQLEKVTNLTLLAVQEKKLNVDLKALTKKMISDLLILGAIQVENNLPKMTEEAQQADFSIYLKPDTENKKNNPLEKDKKQRIALSSNTKLTITQLGNAAIKSGLDLCKSHILYDDLSKAQESLILLDCLHLLYLLTPYNFIEQIEPSRSQYYYIMMQLNEKERKTASILGITESCIIRLLSNKPITCVPERVLNRFYISLMLFDLWNEYSIIQVSEKYQVNRGIVQNLITGASTFASSVLTFCEELNEFWAFAHLIKGMSQKLAHCCCKELSPLMELPAVKQGRARQLFNAGYKNLQSIAKADPNSLVSVIQFMPYKVACQLVAAAKLLLLEKVETLREQAEELLTTQSDVPLSS